MRAEDSSRDHVTHVYDNKGISDFQGGRFLSQLTSYSTTVYFLFSNTAIIINIIIISNMDRLSYTI